MPGEMGDEQLVRFLQLLALLLFLLPVGLRVSRSWGRRWRHAALAVYGAAVLFALWRVAVWAAG